MKTNQRNYKIFDQTEAIEKAKKLLQQIKKQHTQMKYIRIDTDTIVGVKANRTNTDLIVKRIKNKQRKISLAEQIEYGQYA